jgi:hypothetical protein
MEGLLLLHSTFPSISGKGRPLVPTDLGKLQIEDQCSGAAQIFDPDPGRQFQINDGSATLVLTLPGTNLMAVSLKSVESLDWSSPGAIAGLLLYPLA